jgi:hypothetical protein
MPPQLHETSFIFFTNFPSFSLFLAFKQHLLNSLFLRPSKHLYKTNATTKNAPNQQQANDVEIECRKWP